jgi:hypothetical protein
MLVVEAQARKIRDVTRGESRSAVQPVPGGQRPEGGWLGLGRLAATSRVGLHLPPDLKLTDWRHVGHQILLIADSSAWWIGDWLVFGQKNYPERYRHAMQETSLDYQTLKNYAWVARRFPLSSRRAALSFQHHIEVAAVPVPERDVWLDRAQHFGWSRNELRRQLRLAKARRHGGEECPGAEVKLNLAPPRLSEWESAAGTMGRSLIEWIIEVADDAAGAVLGSAEREIGA